MNSLSALRLASFLHLGEQYFELLLFAVNAFSQMWHVVVWAAIAHAAFWLAAHLMVSRRLTRKVGGVL